MFPRSPVVVVIWIVVALAALALPHRIGGQDSRPATTTVEGVRVLSRRPLDVKRGLGAIQPVDAVFRVGDDGLPIVSSAGFLQLSDRSKLVFDAYRLPENVQRATKAGRLDTANWGDVDGFCIIQRVAQAWAATYPAASPLGLKDISAMGGGFPDFNRDGRSDHLTHQMGTNFNVLYPTSSGPPREIVLGKKNTEHYDLQATRRLVALLVTHGGRSLTTSAATRLLEDVPGIDPLPGGFIGAASGRPGYSRSFLSATLGGAVIHLLNGPSDHSDHMNVEFSNVR